MPPKSITSAAPDRHSPGRTGFPALGAAGLYRRRARHRDHRGDRLSRSHSGLPRRLCRRRRVLRHLRLPDHASDRQPVADRALLGGRFLCAADAAHLAATAARDRRHDDHRDAVSAAAARGPRSGEVGCRDRGDDLELLLQQRRSTIFRRRRRSIRCCTPGRSGSRSNTTCWRRRSWA